MQARDQDPNGNRRVAVAVARAPLHSPVPRFLTLAWHPSADSSPGGRGSGGTEGGVGDIDGLDYGDLNALIRELEAARGR